MSRSAPRVYEVTLRLSDVEPVVWRRLRISAGATLARSARVFAVTMGWSPGRPFAFTVGALHYEGRQVGGVWDDVVTVRLRQVLPDAGSELEFEYGNDHAWHLLVRLERLLPPNDEMRTPRCLDGAGGTPPVDVGGPWAYEEWREGSASESGNHAAAELTGAPDRHAAISVRFNPQVVNAELERLR